MSSEMRELIRKEVEQWVGITRNRDIERSARVWMEGYDAALTYCAERISALLARTEAGADGDKTGWQDGWPMAYHTRYRHVLEETIGQPFGEGTRLGSADIRRVAMAMAREFGVPTDTRPQDASGDAERICDYLCEQEYDIGGRDELLAHIRAAMQAKEAK